MAEKDNVPTYSERYYDDFYEYRHVVMPTAMAQKLPKPMRLMTEWEWRSLGVQQSPGWVHYAVHRPEPHVLLFRRPKFYGTPQEVKVGVTAHPENIPVN